MCRDIESEDVDETGGDYNGDDVGKKMITKRVFGDVIGHYRQLADGKQTICYCPSIEMSKAMMENFNENGITAAHIDGETPKLARDMLIERFRGGRIMRYFTKAEQCRNLMYKRSMLAELNYFSIQEYLNDMQEMCSNIHYAFDDDETLINAFDGNEDEAHEFKFSFSDLEYEAEHLCEKFYEMYGYSDDPEREFNDMTVSLIGKYFQLLGFDSYRDDYFAFCIIASSCSQV